MNISVRQGSFWGWGNELSVRVLCVGGRSLSESARAPGPQPRRRWPASGRRRRQSRSLLVTVLPRRIVPPHYRRPMSNRPSRTPDGPRRRDRSLRHNLAMRGLYPLAPPTAVLPSCPRQGRDSWPLSRRPVRMSRPPFAPSAVARRAAAGGNPQHGRPRHDRPPQSPGRAVRALPSLGRAGGAPRELPRSQMPRGTRAARRTAGTERRGDGERRRARAL